MKTELTVVATKYAEAVLELALKEGGEPLADAVYADLARINKVMRGAPDLELILNHPAVPAEKKRGMIVQLFSQLVRDLTMRLLELLLDKRRLNLLQQIESEYHAILNKKKNISQAVLSCSEPLSDKAVADIKARLVEHLGRKLELEVKVDKSLIGGVVLRLGDQVIDGSLKGKLRSIERALLSV